MKIFIARVFIPTGAGIVSRGLVTGIRRMLVWLVIGTFAGNLLAADVNGDFSTANRLYAEGKFGTASGIYERLLSSAGASPNLLFNYGNAEFKAGNLGRSIAAFRRAELLAPRDAEIRANLDYVRNQVQGSTVHESRWQDWLGQLSLNEWTLLTVISFLASLELLHASPTPPGADTEVEKAPRTLCVLLTVLLGAATALQAANHFAKAIAVVTSSAATARSGPFDDAQERV
jgi:tetratricopeptide (TPR) repeat protein